MRARLRSTVRALFELPHTASCKCSGTFLLWLLCWEALSKCCEWMSKNILAQKIEMFSNKVKEMHSRFRYRTTLVYYEGVWICTQYLVAVNICVIQKKYFHKRPSMDQVPLKRAPFHTMCGVLFRLRYCDLNLLAKEHDTQGDRGITCSIFRVYVHEYWQDISVHVTHSDYNTDLQHWAHFQDGL